MSAENDLVEALYDYAVNQPDGFTNADFMAAHDVSLPDFNKAANRLRAILGDDTITLTCDPGKHRQPWVYRLVGTVEDGSPWVQNRLRDAESRFTTLSSVTRSLVNSTDGRSSDGKRARVMHKSIKRLLEDLSEISEEVS